MQSISTIPFAQLNNAEHVAFFSNVAVELDKKTAEALGLTTVQFLNFRKAVTAEQDIVNRSMASVYTADMEAMDAERDRIFRLIRLKLQACLYATPGTAVAELAESVEKNLLNKYGNSIAAQPYQEESALLRGFIYDVTNFFSENQIQTLGISGDLGDLQAANENFMDLYNQRAAERSLSTAELTKKLRTATEELYQLLALHLSFKANNEAGTEVGTACAESLAVVNQIVKDARQRLSQRQGKAPETPEPETTEESAE